MLLTASSAFAQLPIPRLNGVFPAGARQGTTVECTIRGDDVIDATALYFSHPGIKAVPAKDGKFTVTVAPDVPVGPYDVRALTPLGVSNFRAFVVGDWPEVQGKEPDNDPAQAVRVTLPVVVNGRIDETTDLDHYVFSAKKGQRVLVNCWAWRIDSQLDGTLMLYDAKGKELSYSGDYYGKDPFIDFTAPEDGDYTVRVWDFVYGGGVTFYYRLHIGALPHIDAVVPAAVKPGTKSTVTVYGRNLPGGKPAPDGAEILGRPLEIVTREVEAPADPAVALNVRSGEAIRPGQAGLDGMAYRLTGPDGSSNPIFLAFTNDPILVEKEPNDDRAAAQQVPVPCDITGVFAPVGDRDHYTFPAKKGEKYAVEIFGQRQSGLIDPFLTGFDSAGKKAFSVNGNGKNIGQLRFTSNTNDGRWDFTAAADGNYTVQVRDLYFQQRGSPRFTYRVSVRRPKPDFRLIASPMSDIQPDATNVGRGSRHWMDVLAFRIDGFEEPIRVEATNLPPGVTAEPVVIGPGKTSAPLVFSAAADAPLGLAEIRVVGKATVDGTEATRVARGGGLTWGTSNTPGIARKADSVVLAVRKPAPFAVTATPAATTVQAGGKLSIAVKLARQSDWTGDVQLSGFDMPSNATMPLVTIASGATEGKVELTLPAKLDAGRYTFTVNGAGQAPRDYGREPDPKRAKDRNVRVVCPSNPMTITVEAAPAAAKK